MLDALGVVAYSRVRQVKTAVIAIVASDMRAVSARNVAQESQNFSALAVDHRKTAVAVASVSVVSRPASRLPLVSRNPSIRSELVLPSAEIERFLESRMYSHFCLLLAQGSVIPVVENAVLSDTALHFELPPKTPLKLGSMALLRSAWRAKRQAWQAIRLWRKQQC